MKKIIKSRIIKRKKSIDKEMLPVLSLQMLPFCVFLNSYEHIINFLPQGLYFCPSRSLIMLIILLISIAFLIMSIGYSSIGFSLNNSVNFSNKQSCIVILKSNEHRIQRSKVFFIHSFILLCFSSLILMNIVSVVQSNSF